MADLPSILGGMAQGFLDFGKSAVDLFGTGGAAVGDLVDTIRTGKVSTKNQDDFRKWLYNTDSVQDAAAKGLGTALNGVQTVTDYIPGIGAVTRNPLFNAGQGALGGLADEFKTYGKDYDLGRAGERAAVSAGAALASGGLGDALKKSANPLLSSSTVQGLAKGATGGAITGGGYAAIDGGDVMQSALQGAGTGALIGGATGLAQDFMPRKATYDMALTDEEKAARIANAKNMLANEQNPERMAELNNQIKDLGGTLADADMAVNSPRYLTDENGNPRTFYHGSPNANITEFDINQAGKNTRSGERALYFTDSPEVADEFSYERIPTDDLFVENRGAKGRVYPVNLEMNNPLDLDNLTDAQIDELWPYASYMGSWQGKDVFTRDLKNWRDVNNAQLIKGYLDMDKLASSPYDGFMARMYPNQDNQAREYAVFDNSKVKMLEDVLANDDMVVNSAKIAPGQLGLFDDTPTQTPKTGARQTSLFDQPQEGVDYYGDDIEMPATEPSNPYAPVDGQVTQAMRDRAADILGNWKKNGVPENDLYNAIDPETLPAAIKGAKSLGVDNLKNVTKNIFGVDDIKKADINKVIEYAYSDSPNLVNYYSSYIKSESPKSGIYKKIQKEAYEVANARMMDEMTQRLLDSSVIDSSNLRELRRYSPSDHATRSGYTAAADEVLSERLGIAPGNTPKYNGRQDVRGAYGRYSHPALSAGGDLAIFERKMSSPEDAVSTMAHERLHSFQGEAESRNQARYNQEVIDAYNDLHNELKNHYKDWSDTAERYGSKGTGYWQRADEQEARMLQTYLENKGYAQAEQMQSKYRKGEWGNEINQAFDKFFDKLRDLSKRGVALPALAALFGGGAYMASQENDKEKEVK